jgi:hypothetical protein
MAKFIKKPVIIDAWEWDERKGTFLKLKNLGMVSTKYNSHESEDRISNLEIATLEGSHIASKGDMIIRGIAGEFYPCKPHIFKKTYDSVD